MNEWVAEQLQSGGKPSMGRPLSDVLANSGLDSQLWGIGKSKV